MTTVHISFTDKGLKHLRSIAMSEEDGLFKLRLSDLTLLYDNRQPESEFKWGYQESQCARHFFKDFEVAKCYVNAWSIHLNLGFMIECYAINNGG